MNGSTLRRTGRLFVFAMALSAAWAMGQTSDWTYLGNVTVVSNLVVGTSPVPTNQPSGSLWVDGNATIVGTNKAGGFQGSASGLTNFPSYDVMGLGDAAVADQAELGTSHVHDATALTSGTVPLDRLSEITSNQMDSATHAAYIAGDNLGDHTASNNLNMAGFAVTNVGSLAVGDSASAEGVNSMAQGNAVVASGDYSHAEGWTSEASGNSSHAEGKGATASGDYSHAEGETSQATGYDSHAEGDITCAAGYASHSEGSESYAGGGACSHAEGSATFAGGDYSHAEGRGTEALGATSHAEGEYVYTYSDCSHAEGRNTYAGDDYSHAEGDDSYANGYASHAEGAGTRTSESFSHAEGADTRAFGIASHAEGQRTTASGAFSHAEGYTNTASGRSSHAEGEKTIASASYSHAEGYSTTASGPYSHAAGQNATATHTNTYVWGDGTVTNLSSTTNKQYTVYAANGIRLLGGAIYGNGAGLTNLEASALGNGSVTTGKLDMATLDARYVNQAGDTMTGSLTVQGTISGNGSGLTVQPQGNLGMGSYTNSL